MLSWSERSNTGLSMLVSLLCIIACVTKGRQARGEDVARAAVEAQGYFDGAQAILSNLDRYDLLVRAETSIIVDDLLVPKLDSHWRMCLDRNSEMFMFSLIDQKLDASDAVIGKLDRWKVYASLFLVNGGRVENHLPGRGVVRRTAKDFRSALAGVRRPVLTYIGTGEFSESVFNAERQKVRMLRVFGGSDSIEFARQPIPGMAVVTARFDSGREVHTWWFNERNLLPERYSIQQGLDSGSRSNVILSQRITWEDHEDLGWVPTVVESSQPVRVKVEDDAGGKRFIPCERIDDVQLKWRAIEQGKFEQWFSQRKYSMPDLQTMLEVFKEG